MDKGIGLIGDFTADDDHPALYGTMGHLSYMDDLSFVLLYAGAV